MADIDVLRCSTYVIVLLDHSIEHLFNLKFAAKDLERNAKKSEKQDKEEKEKLKKVGILNSCGVCAHSFMEEQKRKCVCRPTGIYNYYIRLYYCDYREIFTPLLGNTRLLVTL